MNNLHHFNQDKQNMLHCEGCEAVWERGFQQGKEYMRKRRKQTEDFLERLIAGNQDDLIFEASEVLERIKRRDITDL